MQEYRVVALDQRTADEVRATLRSPGYGHPAHVEVAKGAGPCRLCLRTFRRDQEERVLFTYDPFPADAALPAPGPVFVHKDACARHDATGFPEGLRSLSLTLEAYDATGLALRRRTLSDDPDDAVRAILSAPDVAYAHLRHTEDRRFRGRLER